MLRLPNGTGPCCRTTHLKVIVQKVTGMAASRITTPPKKKVQKKYKKSKKIVNWEKKKGRHEVTNCRSRIKSKLEGEMENLQSK